MKGLGFLFLIIGVALIIWSIWERITADSIKDWPKTQGVVVSSDYRPAVFVQELSYVVVYEYTVENIRYQCDRICLSDRLDADYLSREYPKDKKVWVLYDPNDPRHAFLETRFPWTSLWITGGGALLALMGFFMVKKPEEWDYQ